MHYIKQRQNKNNNKILHAFLVLFKNAYMYKEQMHTLAKCQQSYN